MTAHQTPSQTIGPFFHDALMRYGVDDLDPDGRAGSPLVVTGIVLDGEAEPVTDAMIEVWQADGAGRFRHPVDGRSGDVPDDFVGFGRVATRDDGRFVVRTVMPGSVPGRAGDVQAPHLNVHVFARGLLDQLMTRIYFAGNEANENDPVLRGVPESRRSTLIATAEAHVDGVPVYRFDLVLQGPDETVFFAA